VPFVKASDGLSSFFYTRVVLVLQRHMTFHISVMNHFQKVEEGIVIVRDFWHHSWRRSDRLAPVFEQLRVLSWNTRWRCSCDADGGGKHWQLTAAVRKEQQPVAADDKTDHHPARVANDSGPWHCHSGRAGQAGQPHWRLFNGLTSRVAQHLQAAQLHTGNLRVTAGSH